MDSYVPSGYEYDTAGSGNFTHQIVMKVCQGGDELRVVEYAMLISLIPPKTFCPKCANPMKLYRRMDKEINQFEWRCHKQRCDKTLSVLTGTVFAGAKIPLATLIMLLFYFANEEPAKKVKDYLKISEKAVTKRFDVGGPGHVVEIDETSLAKKQKYHRGKKYVEFWVFGGFDRTTKKWFAAITFDDRTKETLSTKIAECILPHTHIISDMFASYVSSNKKHTLANNKKLKHLSYMHTWVNHSKNFKDPVTGAHTNGIEGCWEAKLKSKIKKMRGLRDVDHAAAIVDECLWRSWFFHPDAVAENKFAGIVQAIKRHPRASPS